MKVEIPGKEAQANENQQPGCLNTTRKIQSPPAGVNKHITLKPSEFHSKMMLQELTTYPPYPNSMLRWLTNFPVPQLSSVLAQTLFSQLP